MKKITIGLLAGLLLILAVGVVQAADNNYRGDILGLAGNKSLLKGDYLLTDKLNLEFDSKDDEKTRGYRAGLHYQVTDWLGIRAGERYDLNDNEAFAYGGINFDTQFGTSNLRVIGYYNSNYEGKDWNDYEAALRIEMYPNQYLYAGVRGDNGPGFETYSYNTKNEPLFFLRGDYNFQWGKFGINVRPTVYAIGYVLTDLSFKYDLNAQTKIILNVNDYYDQEMKYRLGVEYKF